MKFRVPSLFAIALALPACAPSLGDEVDRMDVAPDDIAWIGETPIYPNATIAENIAAADTFSILARLAAEAGLATTLGGDDPYTIFAPTDAVLAGLLPQKAAELRETLGNHVIPGRIAAADILARIAEGGGAYRAQSLSGDMLTFRTEGEKLMVSDSNGGSALVTQADLSQANGMMHVIDGVLSR